MPVQLKAKDDLLLVTLSGLQGADFGDALSRVKSVPGRRWNSDTKDWEFQKDPDTAMRLMQMLEPEADAVVRSMVKDHTTAVADALVTKLPDDADLQVPYASHLLTFQRSAIDFFAGRRKGILADDMGLGKTTEGLAVIHEARLRKPGTLDGPVLIIAPKPVLDQWADTVKVGPRNKDGTPVCGDDWVAMQPTVVEGTKWKDLVKGFDGEVLIINWEKLRDETVQRTLSKIEWSAVLADEAHRAKNRKAKQTGGLWKMRAPIQLALTGTPIMNSPDELWPLLKWILPEQYTGFWPFHYAYVDEYQTRWGAVMTGVKNVDQLRFELADKLVRRTKEEVLKDLPAKSRVFHDIEMRPKQAKLYREAEEAALLDVVKVLQEEDEDKVASVLQRLEDGDLGGAIVLIQNGAARTTRLRQIASSPALLDGPDESGKMDAAVELIKDLKHEPWVVFTWFEPSARIMKSRLEKLNLRVGTIAGSDDPDPPKALFMDGELDVLVCTIAKGGVGLNLTRASNCVFIERDWTPAINQQAEDRIHRMGQDSPVTIHVMQARDTVDTKNVAKANRLKQMITEQVLGSAKENS